ncbi:MAG: hypothetical protein UV38_C0003G0210 [candidate division TM6 bacterium GW2011_GWE2_42_60]|nr:MAG: hypothetical protein UV38_C0003G0210 [candidate division TM6 bacterium GW2011_GWE2_42_60]HBY05829.1 hypothetical protein [Candidatus Dependentiae bacterium]
MLKKIVKLGNSNALILDKAILELLNMSEGSLVKLTTDGKSLIITPKQPEAPAQEKLTQSYEEYAFAKGASLGRLGAKQDYDSVVKIREAFKALNEKYEGITDKVLYITTNSDEYKKELEVLTKEDEQSGDHARFEAKGLELLCKFVPEYRAYYEELRKLLPQYS